MARRASPTPDAISVRQSAFDAFRHAITRRPASPASNALAAPRDAGGTGHEWDFPAAATGSWGLEIQEPVFETLGDLPPSIPSRRFQ